MPLGLDLRGGLYLLYQVDVNGAVSTVLDSYEQSFRRGLADAKIPFTDVTTSPEHDRPNGLRVTCRPESDATPRAVSALRKVDNSLTFRSLGSGPAITWV